MISAGPVPNASMPCTKTSAVAAAAFPAASASAAQPTASAPVPANSRTVGRASAIRPPSVTPTNAPTPNSARIPGTHVSSSPDTRVASGAR
ncbi:hypothetical protein BJF79_14060 [Actinomadura sp. CNU-125]|nr:hypothetical protein BJF79_14060 [Actinomadura sp. CNU-125]